MWRHWLEEFGRRFRYVRDDARGCGLSETDLSGVELGDVNNWTGDLEAVVEANDLDTFVLLGVSQGAAPAMDYAVKYPDRVSHLILYGGYVRGLRATRRRGGRPGRVVDRPVEGGLGGASPAFRSVFTTLFMPEANSEQMRWFNDLQQQTASAENALLIETAFYDGDFSDLARQVSVPTLVMHCRGDVATPFDEGRRLAGLIPGAEFVTLESQNHVLTADEPAWTECMRQIEHYVRT